MKFKEIVSKTEFEETIQHGITVIDFNAPWCGPCRIQEPILEKIAQQFDDKTVIASVNVDHHQGIAQTLGIQSIPTIIIFKDRKEVKRFVGLQPESILSETLNKLVS
jgi:thioredoxin 1